LAFWLRLRRISQKVLNVATATPPGFLLILLVSPKNPKFRCRHIYEKDSGNNSFKLTDCKELIRVWLRTNGSYMALRKIHIEKIAKMLTAYLVSQKLSTVSEEALYGRIISLINANMEAERSIDDEAHKLLDQNKKMIGGAFDEQKALTMIKKQLAKQKNFVL
jgi:hypothetical protein